MRGHLGKMKGKGAGVGMGEFQTTGRSDRKDRRQGRKEGWIGRGSDCSAALRESQPGHWGDSEQGLVGPTLDKSDLVLEPTISPI